MVPPVARLTMVGSCLFSLKAPKQLERIKPMTSKSRGMYFGVMDSLLLRPQRLPSSVPPDPQSSQMTNLFLLIFRSIEASQLDRIEQVLDLLFCQDLFFANDFENSLVVRVGLARQFGGLLVSQDRVESGDNAYRCLHIPFQDFFVYCDGFDALRSQCNRSAVQQTLGFDDRQAFDWLVGVKLQLPVVGRQAHTEIVADHPEGDKVYEFGNHRVHLARHDR